MIGAPIRAVFLQRRGISMYTYCLFCETGKCGYVARAVMQKIPCRTLSPKQVQHTWAKGKMVDIEHDLLPGYVFVYTENERLDVALLRPIQGIIRCLSSQDREYELTGSDEQFALMLLQKDGVIGKTKVYEEGQMIRICQGAFEGVETKILKVNRRNMRMQIEIPFASQNIKTWVEYEIVKAVDEKE
jgi:transcription antitermination factor NusG